MSESRSYCISIAGFDPCGGAGILADIKTFENLKVMGLGVVSALTYQNDASFTGLQWNTFEQIKQQLLPLKKYPVEFAKIGIIEDFEILGKCINLLEETFPGVRIVWDPVLKASAGFLFHSNDGIPAVILKKLFLLTPNMDEYKQLNLKDKSQCAILLKGGHREEKGIDTLFFNGAELNIEGKAFDKRIAKHGTGCVLSSAIAAYMALGEELTEACRKAKAYVEEFILSNDSNLGYHQC